MAKEVDPAITLALCDPKFTPKQVVATLLDKQAERLDYTYHNNIVAPKLKEARSAQSLVDQFNECVERGIALEGLTLSELVLLSQHLTTIGDEGAVREGDMKRAEAAILTVIGLARQELLRGHST